MAAASNNRIIVKPISVVSTTLDWTIDNCERRIESKDGMETLKSEPITVGECAWTVTANIGLPDKDIHLEVRTTKLRKHPVPMRVYMSVEVLKVDASTVLDQFIGNRRGYDANEFLAVGGQLRICLLRQVNKGQINPVRADTLRELGAYTTKGALTIRLCFAVWFHDEHNAIGNVKQNVEATSEFERNIGELLKHTESMDVDVRVRVPVVPTVGSKRKNGSAATPATVAVPISLDDDEGKNTNMRAHRIVLIARSPVLRTMFSYDMKEGKENVWEIENATPTTGRQLLQYMYANTFTASKLDPRSKEGFAELLTLIELANAYYLHTLAIKVMTYIVDSKAVSKDTHISALQLVQTYRGVPKYWDSCLAIEKTVIEFLKTKKPPDAPSSATIATTSAVVQAGQVPPAAAAVPAPPVDDLAEFMADDDDNIA